LKKYEIENCGDIDYKICPKKIDIEELGVSEENGKRYKPTNDNSISILFTFHFILCYLHIISIDIPIFYIFVFL